MIKIYGLKNCDTCRKVIKELREANKNFEFYDFRRDGLSENNLKEWIKCVGWEILLNKGGTTWRRVGDEDKLKMNAVKATALMLEYPALVKRPVFEIGPNVVVGFKDDVKKVLGLKI